MKSTNYSLLILKTWLLLFTGAVCLISCSKNDDEDPPGTPNPPPVTNHTELVFTGLDTDLYLMEPAFTPAGDGGVFFMDYDNYADHQEIYYIREQGHVLTTGLKPAELATALGYDICVPSFTALGTDSKSGLFFTLYLTADTDDIWILRADINSHQVSVFASREQMTYVFSQTPLGAWYRPFLRSQMIVRPDGNVWLYSNDAEKHVFIYLYLQQGQLFFKWWQIPTPTEEPTYTPLAGLALDGDILLTEMDAGIIWRCNSDNGVSGFLELAGFPNTVSGIAEDAQRNLHFATNYVLNYDISIIQTGYDGEYTVNSLFFTEGVDWLLFGSVSNTGYNLHSWCATDFTESFNRPHVPSFWSFLPDPVSGAIYTLDESNYDIYRTSFSYQSALYAEPGNIIEPDLRGDIPWKVCKNAAMNSISY